MAKQAKRNMASAFFKSIYNRLKNKSINDQNHNFDSRFFKKY